MRKIGKNRLRFFVIRVLVCNILLLSVGICKDISDLEWIYDKVMNILK